MTAAPSERKYYAAADLLRVLSVGTVAWFHIWQQSWLPPTLHFLGRTVSLDAFVRRGYMPVDLMLLLSGFLLFLPWAERAAAGRPLPDTREYFRKRAIRILPSYLFAVLAALLLALVYGRQAGSLPLWADLLTHLTFTHVFFPGAYVWTSLNVVLWTLAVEVQFYLIFPWVARGFLRRPGLTVILMTALALLTRVLVLQMKDPTFWLNQLPCMLDLYAFGMLAAYFHVRRKGFRGEEILSLVGAALCLWGIWLVMCRQHPADNLALQQQQLMRRLPLALLGAGFLYCGGAWPGWANRAVGNRVVRFLAGISYNFYIWHQYLAVKLKLWHIPDYASQMPQREEGPLWRQKYTVICWLVALGMAVLMTYLIEKPFTEWGNQRIRQKKTSLPS